MTKNGYRCDAGCLVPTWRRFNTHSNRNFNRRRSRVCTEHISDNARPLCETVFLFSCHRCQARPSFSLSLCVCCLLCNGSDGWYSGTLPWRWRRCAGEATFQQPNIRQGQLSKFERCGGVVVFSADVSLLLQALSLSRHAAIMSVVASPPRSVLVSVSVRGTLFVHEGVHIETKAPNTLHGETVSFAV